MIKPSDAIIDPGLDSFFKKVEKEAEKELHTKRMKDYLNYIFGGHVDTDNVLEKMKKLEEEEDFSKHMNKPTTPIKIFYSQPMHDKTEDEIKDKTERLDNYIYGILMYSGFKQEDILRIEIIDNLHHEELDPDAGRLKHLGASIQLMEDADLIIFEKDMDYEPAKGCRIELNIAEEYGLKHFYVDDYFSYHITTWFKDYLDKENVSK